MIETNRNYTERRRNTIQSVEDFNLIDDADFFASPTHRLEFMRRLDFDDFYDITKHINERSIGGNPRDLGVREVWCLIC